MPQRVLCVWLFILPMSRISSALVNIGKKESIRGIEEGQVQGPENAACLLKRDTIWQGHEAEIDKLITSRVNNVPKT